MEDEINPLRLPWDVDVIEFGEIIMGPVEPSAFTNFEQPDNYKFIGF